MLRIHQSFFVQKDTKGNEIEKWIKAVNQSNLKSIYDLSWQSFYKELHRLGIRKFLSQYGYSNKRKLQLVIAKSELSQKKLSLYDFETSTQETLFDRLGNSFFDKITLYPNFDPKNHKLSTIHYYLYGNSLYFAALSLGFSSKQNFLNFFAQTLYVPECSGDRARNLRMGIQSLHAVDPFTLRKELVGLYDKPLPKNMRFIRYNYTLEELKLALENEEIAFVLASLAGGNAYAVNKKLRTLRPLINVSLQALKFQSWESLKGNTPIFIWKIKLYQLFLGQMPLLKQQDIELFRPRPLETCLSFYWQFFTPYSTQDAHEEEGLSNLPNLTSSL